MSSVLAPPPAIVAHTQALLPGAYREFLLRAVFAAMGGGRVRPTSWWRDPSRNREVGGHIDSQHQIGLALDLVADDPERVLDEAHALGIVGVDEGTHVHLQLLPPGMARQLGLLSIFT